MAMVTAITTTRIEGLRKRAGRVLAAVSAPCLLGMLLGGSALAQSGQMQTGQMTGTAADLMTAAPLLMGAGDLVDIQIFNTPELSGKARIDQGGLLRMPVGGEIDVRGLTSAQAGRAVEQKLKDAGLMLDPHVTVFVLEYATQGITMLGEVRSPGTYNLFGPHSLYDALSAAGGTTLTEGANITITHRRDPEHPVVVPVTTTNYSQVQRLTPVEPGDTVMVAKAPLFYVVGDVTRPGAYYIQSGEPITVLNAVALAAGVNKTAKMGKVSIVRPTATGAETIPLDLNKIMRNESPNVVLQAADILVVPRSGLKVALETIVPGATVAVASAVATSLVVR